MNYILMLCWQTVKSPLEAFLVAWKEKKSMEQQKKTAVFGLHLWVCIRLNLSKGKKERRCSPVVHHRGRGHRGWLHIQSFRPQTAYKKHLAWSARWMCMGLTCAYAHGSDAAGWCSTSCRSSSSASFFIPVFFFPASFHPSAYDEDRSRDAIIYTYMI